MKTSGLVCKGAAKSILESKQVSWYSLASSTGFSNKMRYILVQPTGKIYSFLNDKEMENTRHLAKLDFEYLGSSSLIMELFFDLQTFAIQFTHKIHHFFLHRFLHNVPIYLPKPGRNTLDDLKGSP